MAKSKDTIVNLVKNSTNYGAWFEKEKSALHFSIEDRGMVLSFNPEEFYEFFNAITEIERAFHKNGVHDLYNLGFSNSKNIKEIPLGNVRFLMDQDTINNDFTDRNVEEFWISSSLDPEEEVLEIGKYSLIFEYPFPKKILIELTIPEPLTRREFVRFLNNSIISLLTIEDDDSEIHSEYDIDEGTVFKIDQEGSEPIMYKEELDYLSIVISNITFTKMFISKKNIIKLNMTLHNNTSPTEEED